MVWYNEYVGYPTRYQRARKHYSITEYGKGSSYLNLMYAVIYWLDDNHLYSEDNDDDTLKVFETLKDADKYANGIEKASSTSNQKVEARVISIEGVKE